MKKKLILIVTVVTMIGVERSAMHLQSVEAMKYDHIQHSSAGMRTL
jgi:hypothetical protein